MYYILLKEDKTLETTVYQPIYRGDHLNQKLTYLIPKTVDDIDVITAQIYLNFVRADGEPDVVMLERDEAMYKEEYYQYRVPVTCKLTRYPGEVITWLQIYTGPGMDPTVAKSGENIIQVLESKDMDTYIGDWRADKQLTALYQMKKEMDEELAETNEAVAANTEGIEQLRTDKADGIVYDEEENSLQLTANGEPIGEKVYLKVPEGKLITEARLTTAGELLFFYSDGSIDNMGAIVGQDGKVYIPHIDEHKILTWTVEDEAGEVPSPVDLNPEDEWHDINEGGDESDYVWNDL